MESIQTNLPDIHGKLCSLLLEEHFGPIVQRVGTDLIDNGTRPLSSILSKIDLPPEKV